MDYEDYTGTGEEANVDTVATDTNDAQVENNGIDNESTAQQPVESTEAKPRTFTQEQVDRFVKKRVERERKKLYGNLQIENDEQYDALMGKLSSYDIMKERYDGMTAENTELKRKLLFIEKNIADSRKEDVLAYFKGKEMELNSDNLTRELQTHPEWLNVVTPTETPKPQTTIKELGAQRGHVEPEDERKRAMRLFGFKD